MDIACTPAPSLGALKRPFRGNHRSGSLRRALHETSNCLRRIPRRVGKYSSSCSQRKTGRRIPSFLPPYWPVDLTI